MGMLAWTDGWTVENATETSTGSAEQNGKYECLRGLREFKERSNPGLMQTLKKRYIEYEGY